MSRMELTAMAIFQVYQAKQVMAFITIYGGAKLSIPTGSPSRSNM
jgi:hypothetical protein